MYRCACCAFWLLSALLGGFLPYLVSRRQFIYLKQQKEVTHFPAIGPPGSRSEVSKPKDSCPAHLFIDDWSRSKPLPFAVLLADNGGHSGARFGNQLFTGGWSTMKAVQLGWPLVVIPRQPQEIQKQIHRLPCLRSSLGAEEALAQICDGCNPPPNLWSDRNHSCNGGKGCRQFLQKKGILRDMAGNFYWHNFREWPTVPQANARQVLADIFHVPLPKLDPPVDLPGSHDLVMHFRAYGLLFGEQKWNYRLHMPPFDFWKWTVEHHRNRSGVGQVWVVTEPNLRSHPTLLRLQDELGVQVFTRMDAMGKDAWLGDFSWLTEASSLALSFSSFSWWAGYIGKAGTIYMVLPPTVVPLPWCPSLPRDDPRYVFYDFYNDESFTDGAKAIQRCETFKKCARKPNDSCPSSRQNFLNLLHRYYPEVLSNLSKDTQEFKLLKKINASLAGDTSMVSKGNQ